MDCSALHCKNKYSYSLNKFMTENESSLIYNIDVCNNYYLINLFIMSGLGISFTL